MLSKSRGQLLRVAAVLHVLFEVGNNTLGEPSSNIISDEAVKAAINFIEVTCQQTAYIAGRGTVKDEIKRFKSGKLAELYTLCYPFVVKLLLH